MGRGYVGAINGWAARPDCAPCRKIREAIASVATGSILKSVTNGSVSQSVEGATIESAERALVTAGRSRKCIYEGVVTAAPAARSILKCPGSGGTVPVNRFSVPVSFPEGSALVNTPAFRPGSYWNALRISAGFNFVYRMDQLECAFGLGTPYDFILAGTNVQNNIAIGWDGSTWILFDNGGANGVSALQVGDVISVRGCCGRATATVSAVTPGETITVCGGPQSATRSYTFDMGQGELTTPHFGNSASWRNLDTGSGFLQINQQCDTPERGGQSFTYEIDPVTLLGSPTSEFWRAADGDTKILGGTGTVGLQVGDELDICAAGFFGGVNLNFPRPDDCAGAGFPLSHRLAVLNNGPGLSVSQVRPGSVMRGQWSGRIFSVGERICDTSAALVNYVGYGDADAVQLLNDPPTQVIAYKDATGIAEDEWFYNGEQIELIGQA